MTTGGCPRSPISIDTTDLDETRTALATHFYANEIHLLPPSTALHAQFEVLSLGPLTVGNLSCGADVRMTFGELGAYHVDVVLSGHLAWRQGTSEARLATESRAAVFQPVGDTVLERWNGDARVIAVKIERTALESHLEQLLGTPLGAPLRLDSTMDVTQGPGRTWAGLVRLLADETAHTDGLLGQPMVAERLVDAVVGGLLLATDHTYREQLDQPDRRSAPRAVRLVTEAIHAHPERPYTSATLAALAECSVRTLQERFQHHLGTTPMAYLREVRLARAHDELREAERDAVTVAEVAYRWGFTHLGRFGTAYRRKYGRPPSETLRRG